MSGSKGTAWTLKNPELGATLHRSAHLWRDEAVVIGALSLSGPTPRIQDKQNKVAHSLKGVAAAISRSLSSGYVNQRDSSTS